MLTLDEIDAVRDFLGRTLVLKDGSYVRLKDVYDRFRAEDGSVSRYQFDKVLRQRYAVENVKFRGYGPTNGRAVVLDVDWAG